MVAHGKIRSMTQADLQEVVQVHLQSFPGFFLSFLGPKFLKELYAGIMSDNSGIAYVAVDNGRITGFVAGTDEPSGFYKRLLHKRWWRFGIASFSSVAKNPRILPRLLKAKNKIRESLPLQNTGLLMSIAVLPDIQGKGVGHKLIAMFLLEASRRGLNRVFLETDRENNNTVNQFYLSHGFQLVRSYKTHEGREMIEYEIGISSKRSSI